MSGKKKDFAGEVRGAYRITGRNEKADHWESVCVNCGSEHVLSLKQVYQKTRYKGMYCSDCLPGKNAVKETKEGEPIVPEIGMMFITGKL